MASIVRLTNDARQTFTTVLGGSSLRLTAWWQPSDDHWYLSVGDITHSVRLVERGLPLAGLDTGLDGQLFVYGDGAPGRQAWGSTHHLIYLTNAELGI